MLARLILTTTGVIASGLVGVVVPATAAPVVADVSPTSLPPSAPGRLAYSTATYQADSHQTSLAVHGLGTIGLDGSDQRTLTDPSPVGDSAYAGHDHSPQWSPDGTWLAYPPLATAGLAAFEHQPLLYATRSSVPPATRVTIRRLSISSVTVIGDDNDAGSRLLRQLAHLDVTVHRVRSSDPYEISALFAGRALDAGASADHPIVASGTAWASSVTTPALAALLGQVTVLVDHRTLADSRPTARWLSQHRPAIRTVKLIGGVRVARPLGETQLERRVR